MRHDKPLIFDMPDLDAQPPSEWLGNEVTLVRFVSVEDELSEAVREVTATAMSCAAAQPRKPFVRPVEDGWEISVTFLREAPALAILTPFGWLQRPARGS